MKKLIFSLLILASIASLSYADRIKWFDISYADKSPGEMHILTGSTVQFGAYGRYADRDYFSKDEQPIWSTSNYWIADINDRGQLRAIQPGTVEVYATKDGLTASLTVIITTNEAESMPPVPTGLRITDITSTSAMVTWDNAKYNNEIVYLLSIGMDEKAEDGGLPVRVEKPYMIKWNVPVSHKLRSDTTYYIKLKVFSPFGASDWTKPVSFTTSK